MTWVKTPPVVNCSFLRESNFSKYIQESHSGIFVAGHMGHMTLILKDSGIFGYFFNVFLHVSSLISGSLHAFPNPLRPFGTTASLQGKRGVSYDVTRRNAGQDQQCLGHEKSWVFNQQVKHEAQKNGWVYGKGEP